MKALFEYTLMPMHSRSMFALNELEGAELHPGLILQRSTCFKNTKPEMMQDVLQCKEVA